MPYMDFPKSDKGMKERKAFWLSEQGVTLIAGWRREGMTIEEITLRQCGVSETTFRRWCKESEALESALRCAQDSVNAKVEESLLKRALGYVDEEETWELVEGEMRRVKVVRKPVPPDVKACLSWLYSRRSDRWRAIQEPRDTTSEDIADVKNVLVSIVNVATGALPEAQPEVIDVDPTVEV